jgi:hypothetical protein
MLNADPTIAKGIMLAGPYGSIEELIEYQLNFTLDLLEQFESTGRSLSKPKQLLVWFSSWTDSTVY